MSSDAIEPIEEDPNTAEAVDDEAPVAALAPSGRGTPDSTTPVFREPGEEPVYRTGAEQQWDPEDYAVAKGWDPTPENVERARKELAEWGPAAIEKTVP
ncbi:hypothetical protein AB0H43_15870 [Hamadaea sp. NPDC050747]|uniref:hypothetical protein n=1 Tax=Hamadaea sp. NPDC050747 TaxID=3155789 RepID=UPI0033EAD971